MVFCNYLSSVLEYNIVSFTPYSEDPSMGESVLTGACARTIVGITLLPVTVLKARFEVI